VGQITMIRLLAITGLAGALAFAGDVEQPAVHVEPAHLQGPRILQKQTETAAIRDYLRAWQSMRTAFDQNRSDLLDADFVGTAKDKLADTIQEQAKLGIRTRYQDRAHDLQIVFYSPDGLSIQLVDSVDYDVQIFDHDKLQTTQKAHARYIAVLTPAEVRWRVRVFQGGPE
jgi:hypothetical protein